LVYVFKAAQVKIKEGEYENMRDFRR